MKSRLLTLASLALASAAAYGVKTSEPSYLTASAGSDFTFEPILTVGDRVPLTGGNAADDYAFAGIPDAMGLWKDAVSGQNVLFVSHEMTSGDNSKPLATQPRFKGAFVSRYILSNTGDIASGAPAHSKLFAENTLVANRPPQEGDANAFTRFCSGHFAGAADGLDRPFFFANEENPTGTYNANGAQSVAIVDGEMHTLPALGRVARENTVVMPRRDAITAIVSTEDNGSPSYVYLYIGTKQRRSDSALDKNGLTGGKVYVLAGRDAQHNEGTFTSGTLNTKWVELPGAAALNATQIRTAADNAGAFGFVRVEDEEFDPNQPTRSLFFTTTGGSGPNNLGRVYELTFNPTNPIANGTLNVVYNADTRLTPGGTYNGTVGKLLGTPTGSLGTYSGGVLNNGVDGPVSADNIAINDDVIVLCEDRNAPADAVFAKYARNGGAWTLDRHNSYAPKLQTTFNYASMEARDAHAPFADAGYWETSGVINTDDIFGKGSFLINVQAHTKTVNLNAGGTGSSIRSNCPGDTVGTTLTRAEAVTRYVEDGQVLIMHPVAN